MKKRYHSGIVEFFCILGIGYGQLIGTICVATYYCSLMAITLFYLINSFTSDLPWAECNDEWNETLIERELVCVPSKSTDFVAPNDTATASSSELYFTYDPTSDLNKPWVTD